MTNEERDEINYDTRSMIVVCVAVASVALFNGAYNEVNGVMLGAALVMPILAVWRRRALLTTQFQPKEADSERS